jgi:aromatic-ring opening dioxygenase LigAB LigA subunit
VNPQLEGVGMIEGTYPFDVSQSVKTLRLNRFLWQLSLPEHRERFVRDEAAAYAAAGLTPEETRLVRERDWLGLIHYGVNFFVLEKIARVLKLSNLDLYAQMRGETLEAFLQTRRVPEAR